MRLPNGAQRLSVMGRTGSGKSVFALWALSHASIASRPWLIIDYKYETEIAKIGRDRNLFERASSGRRIKLPPSQLVDELKPGAGLPRRPGLYIMHPLPDVDDDAVQDTFWKIWERGNAGVFIDEAHMIPDKPAFRALLTQGRSKRIPMIIVSQRPCELSRFVFTQADFFAVFKLKTYDDIKRAEDYLGQRIRDVNLPEYHCIYNDVAKDETTILQPVSHPSMILDRIEDRLPRRFWY